MEASVLPSFEEFRQEILAKRHGKLVRTRLGMAAVAWAALLGVTWLEASSWRFELIVAVMTFGFLGAVADAWRFHRREVYLAHGASLVFLVVLLLTVVFTTGALESPVLLLLPVTVMSTAIVLGVRPLLLATVAMMEAGIWVFALGEVNGWLPPVNPALFGGGARGGENDAHLWATAIVASLVVALAAVGGTRIRVMVDHILARALAARQDELAAHTEHGRELGVLAGEVAHELKNPLASVKCLAALVARDAEGKDAERLGVLREEVDRMEAILAEFLNFSRPLVPLDTVRTDLAGLCEEVAALHEAMGKERSVELRVSARDEVPVRCDPRKVRQVLINLVQNALDASPPGGAVDLVARRDGDRVYVDVADRGAGVAKAVAGRMWEPGVTTKDDGSGLGLTIARALCRQHGGDLDVVPRDGGGTRAVVSLPAGVA